MTDSARSKLLEAQPLYSRDLLKETMSLHDIGEALEGANAYLHTAKEMLGSTASVRFASQVFDAATGQEVAGRQIGRLIELSLRAENSERVFHHEAFHYAHENLLDDEQRQAVDRAFADGSRLNTWTRESLVRQKMPEAVKQCDDPKEAAAHAFSLWKTGEFAFKENLFEGELSGIDRMAQKVFQVVEKAVDGFSGWMKRLFGERQVSSDSRVSEEIFRELAAGRLAATGETYEILDQDDEIPTNTSPRRVSQRGG